MCWNVIPGCSPYPNQNEDDGASMMGAGYVGDDFGEKGPHTYTTSTNLSDIFSTLYLWTSANFVMTLVVDVIYVNTPEE